MLTSAEKRKIRRYATLHKSMIGICVMIGPTIFYLPVALYVCFGLLHSLRHSTKWLNIVQKVAASNGITEQSAPDAYDTTIIGLRFHPEAVAQRGHKSSRRPSDADKR